MNDPIFDISYRDCWTLKKSVLIKQNKNHRGCDLMVDQKICLQNNLGILSVPLYKTVLKTQVSNDAQRKKKDFFKKGHTRSNYKLRKSYLSKVLD